MEQLNGLLSILAGHFKWNKARMDCFAGMLCSLFAVRTVNLSEIAVGFSSDAQISSRYRRLNRFFADYEIGHAEVARFIFLLFFSKRKKLYLTIDRTNWYWGKSKINILTLGIAYEGAAIPILWMLLDKAGNASAEEHISIMERFIKTFPKGCIAGVLADREFASGKFFHWLNTRKIPFYIRIKEDYKGKYFNEKGFKLRRLFKDLNPKEQSYQLQPITVLGVKLFAAAGRADNGDLLIVITNQNPKNAVAIYLRRWEIETLFQSLKSRGFRFEETHMTKLDRIEKLTALLAIGFAWAHKVGEWRAIKKPIALKKFTDSYRPQNSYFRYGFDLIRDAILHINRLFRLFRQCLKQLIPPNIGRHKPKMRVAS